jgi:hypothetical protein
VLRITQELPTLTLRDERVRPGAHGSASSTRRWSRWAATPIVAHLTDALGFSAGVLRGWSRSDLAE